MGLLNINPREDATFSFFLPSLKVPFQWNRKMKPFLTKNRRISQLVNQDSIKESTSSLALALGE